MKRALSDINRVKTTLVLLPGLNGTTGLFAPFLEQVNNKFEVIPVSYPTDEIKSYRDLTDLVLEKVKSVDGRFVVLGESFSGPISLFLSQSRPKGLVGVVLVATFIHAPNLRIGRFLPWKLGFTLTKPLYSLRLALTRKGNKGLVSRISSEMQKVSPLVLSARIREIFDVNAADALRDCHVPLMYLRGTRDIVVPKSNLRDILSVRPDLRVVEFNTQHFLLQSQPNKALLEIERFIAECT